MKVRLGPDGIHLFNRVSGQNVLIDEVSVPPQLWHLAPRYVSIALTNACELSCPYCYAPKERAVLSVDLLKDWTVELDANGCLGVGFGGGEPTLHPGFSELCKFLAKETFLAVTFTTHGHRITSTLAEDLTDSVHFIRVSMDGIGTTYELLRERPFSNLISSIKLIRRLCPFGINFVVNGRTLPDLQTAVDMASDLGAAEFLLLPERPMRGRAGVQASELTRLRHWVEGYKGHLRLNISESHTADLPVCDPHKYELAMSSFDTFTEEVSEEGVIAAMKRLMLKQRTLS